MLSPAAARNKLQSATRLHYIHWIIVVLALVLSLAAWSYSKSSVNARAEAMFDREADQVIELVQHRMTNYADALWGGVAMIQASGDDVGLDRWEIYADSIQIEQKYPGINGIGVIHAVSEQAVPVYLAEQRRQRPDFNIHPPHDGEERYPIVFIVPVAGNEKTVGLDMAHESSRYSAVKNSRDTGLPQITGPITLTQGDDKSPGFLFFAPYYDGGAHDNRDGRRQHFSGLVYAPFVAKKLMDGVLEKAKRQVGIRLADGESVLYDEHVTSEPDFDSRPLFKRSAEVSLYGRTWTFDVRSTNSFREASFSAQPLLILLGGIVIDALLVLLFVSISRSSLKALTYADSMTHQFEANARKLEASQALFAKRAAQLENSNAELEQFTLLAAHDLQEPLGKVASFCGLIREEYGEKLGGEGIRYVECAIDGTTRMRSLVQDLLLFSGIGSEEPRAKPVDTDAALQLAILNLRTSIDESQAEITHDPLPSIVAYEREISHLFQNLIGNAIKYRSDQRPEIHVGVTSRFNQWQFSIDDNGVGIAPEFREQVFGVFKRLHSRKELPGTGIGLAICKRVVEQMGGQIWFETKTGPGCRICFTVQKHETAFSNSPAAGEGCEYVATAEPG